MSRHTHPLGGLWQVTESGLWLSDTTIADVSTARHGLVPKAPNDTSKFLRGDGTWAQPATGTGGQSYIDDFEAIDDALNDNFSTDASLDTGGTRFAGASAWSWVNQGGASATIVRGRLHLVAPSSATANKRIIVQTLPSGNWRYRAQVGKIGTNTTTVEVGMVLRESGTGKLITFQIGWSAAFLVWCAKWTNPTTFSATYTTNTFSSESSANGGWMKAPGWLEIEYDGTNYAFRYALNGIAYHDLTTRAKADFFTTGADEIGLHAYNDCSVETTLVCRQFYRVA